MKITVSGYNECVAAELTGIVSGYNVYVAIELMCNVCLGIMHLELHVLLGMNERYLSEVIKI